MNISLKDILYDGRWIGDHGIGRFAKELQKELPGMELFRSQRPPFHPLDPVLLGVALLGKNPKLFFSPGYNSPLGWPGRFVFNLHDLNHLRVPENSSAAKRAYYQFIIKPACHRASFVLTVSEYSKSDICDWAGVCPKRVINVGNGVGPPFSPTGRRYEPGFPYLVYVGSHKSHKNIPRLLKAFAISTVRKDVKLLLTGDPEKQLARALNHLGLGSDAMFIGSPTDAELSEVYRGALALIFPSLYEGFGLPPVEAMACGTPVLTSNICALPEIVGDAAILVDPLDTESIANGICRIVSDSELREALRKRGLARSHLFTWQETGAKTLAVLRAALEGSHAPRFTAADAARIR